MGYVNIYLIIPVISLSFQFLITGFKLSQHLPARAGYIAVSQELGPHQENPDESRATGTNQSTGCATTQLKEFISAHECQRPRAP